jgi:hypothetical protein
MTWKCHTLKKTKKKKGMRARLGSERFGVQIPVKATHFFSNFLSQINIGLNISVESSLIANLLKLKRWKALVALYKNKLVYNLTTCTLTQTNSAPSVL